MDTLSMPEATFWPDLHVPGERTTIKVFPSSRRRMSRFEIYRDAWHYFGGPGIGSPSAETK